MTVQNKTHYRKVFKSDHLGQADLEDFMESGNKKLIFTIAHVRQEQNARVAGKKINANIAYFQDKGVKPLVLNATNSKVMKQLTGSPFVEDWQNVTVQLYIDTTVKMKGDTVGGVRINPNPVQQMKLLDRSNEKLWLNAIAAYKRDGNFNAVLERYKMTDEDMQFIASGVQNGSL